MPANEDDNVSTHSDVSYSDYNRFTVSETAKKDIFSQIQESTDSLPLWGQGAEEEQRPRQNEIKEVTGAKSVTKNVQVEDTSDLLTPTLTRKDNPLEKIPTASDDQGSGKGSRPGVLRRLTTRLKRVSTAQRSHGSQGS